jgi:hypothetical protein
VSMRSLQYRFLQAALELGYFDQAHLTNSLKRFVGKTPAQIARKSTVG